MIQAHGTSGIPLERACHLCGSSRGEILAERDRDGQPLRTVLCPGCGLVFTDPRPSADALDRYYPRDYRQEYKGARTPRPMQVYRNALTAIERLTRIRPYLTAGSKVLDIGSGSGEFLYFLRHAGYRASGLEPDSGYSAFARDRLGLDVESRPLGPPPPSGSPFSAVTIFHVLEHLEEPRKALATLEKWLAPGGLLVAEAPNVESRRTAPHHRFHRAHIFNFNRATLAAMGEVAGFTVTDTILTPDGGTITVVFVREENPGGLRSLTNNASRVRRALEGYTNLDHYLGGTLLRRQLEKLGQNLRGRWLCRGHHGPEDILKRVAEEAEVAGSRAG